MNNDANKLSKEEVQFSHHNVAKLIFLHKRARLDLQTSIAFLSTQVKMPDIDDKKNFRHALWYFQATNEMPLTLELTA
eukprot:12918030-Ditylum_brightwellii.AAC.1